MGLIWNQEIWKLVDPWYMIGDTVVEDINHHIISSRWYKLGTLPATELTKLAHGVTCSQTDVCKYLKKHLDITVNSQGREQTNSLIEKCANSLRQKKTISINCDIWKCFCHKKFNVNETYQYISYILILHLLYLGAVQVSCDRLRVGKKTGNY